MAVCICNKDLSDNLLAQIKLAQAILDLPHLFSAESLKQVKKGLHKLVVRHHALNHSDDIDF